jgi:hypothetical protein
MSQILDAHDLSVQGAARNLQLPDDELARHADEVFERVSRTTASGFVTTAAASFTSQSY